MIPAFVFGNGVSRLEVDMAQCKNFGPIYACNAVYREYTPDVLVATDRPIAEAIQNSGYADNNVFYTRRPIGGLNARVIPQQWFGYSSGPIAAALASKNYKVVYLVGFDLGPSASGKFNNVYADTEFYKRSSAVPTYTGNWIRQLISVMKENPKHSFFRIVGKTTADIHELNGVKNLKHMPMAEFLNRINNTKEL